MEPCLTPPDYFDVPVDIRLEDIIVRICKDEADGQPDLYEVAKLARGAANDEDAMAAFRDLLNKYEEILEKEIDSEPTKRLRRNYRAG